MDKITVKIRGMHCRSCEILIADKIKEIPDIQKVDINFRKNEATVYSKNTINQKEIENAIQEAGYDIGEEQNSLISRNPKDYKDIIVSIIILFILFLAARKLGLFNLSFASSNKPSSLFIVLLVGLTAGVSSCMALVGGLILGIAARFSEVHPEATTIQKFRPHLFFNLGRVLSYTILGGLIGLIGKAFQFSGTTLGLLTIIVGLVMLILGLQLTELFPRLSSGGFTLPTSISKFLGLKKHNEREYSHFNSAMIGALTFFLPCGFTQAMQLFAMTTGNFVSGALIMGVFALGTTPGLLGVGGLTSLVKGAMAKKFFKFVGLLVVALAIFNLSNGFNLIGFKIRSSQVKTANSNIVVENGIQIARMDQLSGGYNPNKFTVTAGIPVKWIINSKDSNSCAASIYSAKLNVRKYLQPGENIIEFTPQEIGTIQFTCSMGMYRGSFNVIANKNSAPQINGAAAAGTASAAQDDSNFQGTIFKTTYTNRTDIQPNRFTAPLGKPVRLEITAQDQGQGCMSSITVPGLVKDFDYLEKGKTIIFNFTPTKTGDFYITCAMGSPRGIITIE